MICGKQKPQGERCCLAEGVEIGSGWEVGGGSDLNDGFDDNIVGGFAAAAAEPSA